MTEVKENNDVAEPFIVQPSNGKATNEKDVEGGNAGTCCKGKCTWKKCGIITGAISVVVVLILAAGALRWYLKLTGEASSEDSDEWNDRLTEDQNEDVDSLSRSIVDGEFLLVSFDKNYADFLVAMGMPSFVATLVTSAREVITFQEPSEESGFWTRRTKTDIDDKSVDFRMGEPFVDVMGRSRKVNLDSNCSLGGEKNNVLTCRAEAKETGLIIESVQVFSRQGFIDTRTLVKQGVTTKKYYERVSRLQLEEGEPSDNDEELSNKIKEAADEAARQALENPFSSDTANDDDFNFDRK